MRYFVWFSTFAMLTLLFVFHEKKESKPHQKTYYGYNNSKPAPWQNETEVDIYRKRVYRGPIEGDAKSLHERLVCD
jgi:hypothetical protein